MHPTLLQLGEGFALRSYGVTMSVAFVVAILLGVRQARPLAISVERLLDLTFWILASSLLGSRLLYAITNADQFYRICAAADLAAQRSWGELVYSCTRALHIWEGGFVYFGGVIAAALVSIIYVRRHRMNYFRTADLIIPMLALGHFFGRMGCFAAGCCYGKPTASALGVAFPPESLAYMEMAIGGLVTPGAAATPALHPTQLYEAMIELFVFVGLLFLHRRRRYHGQVFLAYLVIYPIVRIVIELFRADPGRRYLVELATPGLNAALGLPAQSPSLISTSQALAVLCIIVSLILGAHLRRRARALR